MTKRKFERPVCHKGEHEIQTVRIRSYNFPFFMLNIHAGYVVKSDSKAKERLYICRDIKLLYSSFYNISLSVLDFFFGFFRTFLGLRVIIGEEKVSGAPHILPNCNYDFVTERNALKMR